MTVMLQHTEMSLLLKSKLVIKYSASNKCKTMNFSHFKIQNTADFNCSSVGDNTKFCILTIIYIIYNIWIYNQKTWLKTSKHLLLPNFTLYFNFKLYLWPVVLCVQDRATERERGKRVREFLSACLHFCVSLCDKTSVPSRRPNVVSSLSNYQLLWFSLV